MYVDIIKLYGSMELAPLVGLADCIVDLVSTGGTLRANDLVAVEDIMSISSRLIVNQAALRPAATACNRCWMPSKEPQPATPDPRPPRRRGGRYPLCTMTPWH